MIFDLTISYAMKAMYMNANVTFDIIRKLKKKSDETMKLLRGNDLSTSSYLH